MDKILIVLVCGIMGVIAFGGILYATDADAKIDCTELQKQAATYPPYHPATQTGFYITKDQAAECASVHMTVNAAVL